MGSCQNNSPVNALIILDGWGISNQNDGNAVAIARTPFIDSLIDTFPHSELSCSGLAVGLPENTMGNSEVGHMNIGAGRKVFQDLVRINQAIDDRSFFSNAPLLACMDQVKQNHAGLHLMGLLSDGGVHSHITHLFALIDMALDQGIKNIFIHPILDGRDTPPRSGINYIRQLENFLSTRPCARVATICGRYWTMDRDTRWDRVQKAYRLYTEGTGIQESNPVQAVQNAYDNDETDEFVSPIFLPSGSDTDLPHRDGTAFDAPLIKSHDGLIFFNFRADRAKQITRAFTDPDFNGFNRTKILKLAPFVCMTQYDESFDLPVAFGPLHLDKILGEILSEQGLRQLRLAETEKYAHVTYFFNGGEDTVFENEERILIPSPRDVATYDEKPEMSAGELARTAKENIEKRRMDFMVLNFANMDMVGHTGIINAAVAACETVDACLKTVVEAVWATGGWALITADHGNSETMIQKDGSPHTAHTLNPVRLILAHPLLKDTPLTDGILGDIAPTILKLLKIEQPYQMTGTPPAMTPTITDYITGKTLPDIGSEGNRQAVEKLLIEAKGYLKSDIKVNEPIEVIFNQAPYASTLDLIVFFKDKAVMAIKCVAGSIGSYEREIIAGARLIYDYQIPLAAVTDGRDAVIIDTLSGKQISQGLDTLPSKEKMASRFSEFEFSGIDIKKKEREMIIFRSFNMDKINR